MTSIDRAGRSVDNRGSFDCRPRDPASADANLATARPSRSRHGVVESFDADRGLGTIVGADGERYRFHAIEIANGGRQIEVGTAVSFEPLWRFGEIQAGRIDNRYSAPDGS